MKYLLSSHRPPPTSPVADSELVFQMCPPTSPHKSDAKRSDLRRAYELHPIDELRKTEASQRMGIEDASLSFVPPTLTAFASALSETEDALRNRAALVAAATNASVQCCAVHFNIASPAELSTS